MESTPEGLPHYPNLEFVMTNPPFYASVTEAINAGVSGVLGDLPLGVGNATVAPLTLEAVRLYLAQGVVEMMSFLQHQQSCRRGRQSTYYAFATSYIPLPTVQSSTIEQASILSPFHITNEAHMVAWHTLIGHCDKLLHIFPRRRRSTLDHFKIFSH